MSWTAYDLGAVVRLSAGTAGSRMTELRVSEAPALAFVRALCLMLLALQTVGARAHEPDAGSIESGRLYYQTYCRSCHQTPPSLASTGGGAQTGLNLSAKWMAAARGDRTAEGVATSLQQRLHQVGATGPADDAMLALSLGSVEALEDVHRYLIAVRDGVVTWSTTDASATASPPSGPGASFVVSISNFRDRALDYRIALRKGANGLRMTPVAGTCARANGTDGKASVCRVVGNISFRSSRGVLSSRAPVQVTVSADWGSTRSAVRAKSSGHPPKVNWLFSIDLTATSNRAPMNGRHDGRPLPGISSADADSQLVETSRPALEYGSSALPSPKASTRA